MTSKLKKRLAEIGGRLEKAAPGPFARWPYEVLTNDLAYLKNVVLKQAQALARIRAEVDAQALDDGLWFEARFVTEGYLQQELRKLHATVEAALAELKEAEEGDG